MTDNAVNIDELTDEAPARVTGQVSGKTQRTRIGPAGSQPLAPRFPEPGVQTAIIKVERKVGSALPTFSAPPIDEVVLSNLSDADLVSVAKNACSIHTQAGAYAREFLAEMKRRFNEDKKLRKHYLGYKNFDKLCANKLEICARQVRNILNNNPSGKKGRVLKPRPTLKEVENVNIENKRLKAHVKLIEDANDRASEGSARPVAGYTRQDVEQAKKDGVKDYQKIAAKDKQEHENEIAALKDSVRKLTEDNRKLQKQPGKSTGKPGKPNSGPSLVDSPSPIDGSENSSKEEAVSQILCFDLPIIKKFSLCDKRWIVDEVVARLRDELARYTQGAQEEVCL
jgi:hypothetical protein